MMAFCLPVTAKAASGSLQLSALSETVSKGSQVTVVCQVASAESFADVSFRLSYDDSILTFLSGGKKVSGGNGMLEIASTGNTADLFPAIQGKEKRNHDNPGRRRYIGDKCKRRKIFHVE